MNAALEKHSKNPDPVLEALQLSVAYEAAPLAGDAGGLHRIFRSRRIVFPVLGSLSFRIPFERPLVGIVGPNGAGKTTLLRAIAGIVPCNGKIIWKNNRIDRLTQCERSKLGVTFVSQEDGNFPNLTVQEYLRLVVPVGEAISSVVDRLSSVSKTGDLPDGLVFLHRGEKVGNLSVGERKLLGLIRLLFRKSSLVLLDEPTCGLSVQSLATFHALIQQLEHVCILQTEQYSKAEVLKQAGAMLFELRDGTLNLLG